jgi:hypothetical protein
MPAFISAPVISTCMRLYQVLSSVLVIQVPYPPVFSFLFSTLWIDRCIETAYICTHTHTYIDFFPFSIQSVLLVFFYFETGSWYEGSWIKGKRHGIGVAVDGGGQKYDGYHVADKRHGCGVWVWVGGWLGVCVFCVLCMCVCACVRVCNIRGSLTV